MSFDALKEWIGREEEHLDVATAAPLTGLAATLDHLDPPWAKGEIPPLGHWLYFLPNAPQREISGDGHPHRGGFLPPVPLPRRMWAAGEFKFLSPIRVGDAIQRRSTIAEVNHKTGRSGVLVFVKVVHEISMERGTAVREVHDIVYREAPKSSGLAISTAEPVERVVDWERRIDPDPVLLFRFSALTFNGHRIHYDRKYCEEVEGYPGLIVHGPLTAMLLLDLFQRNNPATQVTAFRFRAHAPLFDINAFTVCGAKWNHGAGLWAFDHTGQVAMTAQLEAG